VNGTIFKERVSYTEVQTRLRKLMVGVAQLVEHRIVIPAVVGSSPIVHPKFETADHSRFDGNGPLAQLAEQLTLNQLVVGSSPTWPTTSPENSRFEVFFRCV
jgi:hypothetical protein